MISFLYVPGPVKLALFPCSASAIAELGPIVKASVGRELLEPKLPEKVLLLRIRQKPPDTVRDLGLSIVAVGCGAAALATRNVAANIVKKNCAGLVLVPMVSRIVNWRDCGFQAGASTLSCRQSKKSRETQFSPVPL